MNYVRVGGYIPPQPIEDYNDLPNIPVISQDLTASGFTPIANTYYKHTGATTASYTNGVIYYYNSTGYIALDGSDYGLATVAKTGSYNDLSNKPTIPDAANNGTLTIQKNGTNVATFGANQSTNTTANITVPTKASDIEALPISGGSITGNLTVGGNLTINGTTTTVDSTTLQVKDKLIEVAHGNTTTLTTPAGLVAPKYDGTSSGALVFDSTGTAYVGDVTLDSAGNIDVSKSELQPLATRTGLVGGNLVQYDSTALTLKDSGKKISDFATSVKVNDNTIAPSGGVVDIGTVLTDASKFATAAQGSNADSALTKANANATEISNIKNGTTKVKSAEHADTADSATSAGTATKATEAMNVTENIKGHAIADIFESDGTTVKKATSAGTADKVANGLTIANATFDGSKPLTIGTSGEHIEIMGGSAASPNRVSIGLKYGNLMPSSYNKVTIDGYGIVVDGENVNYLTSHQGIKKLNTNNTTAQDANASEDIAGSGTINLHKVAKTGSYNDLVDKPTIPTDYVKYTAQTLTDAQKSQARSNIGAGTSNFDGTWGSLSGKPNVVQSTGNSTSDVMSQNAVTNELAKKATTSEVNAKYTKPSGGIPKSDLASSVQTSLGKADTALQNAPVTSVNGKTGAVTVDTTNARAELVTIATTDWVADSTIAPFAYKAAKTLTTYNMGGYDAVSMGYAKNADLLVGATSGIAIGEVPITLGGGKNITFYSAAQPTAQVQIVVYLESILVQGID